MIKECLASATATGAFVGLFTIRVRPKTSSATLVDMVASAAIASFLIHLAAYAIVYGRFSETDNNWKWSVRVLIHTAIGLIFFCYMGFVVNAAAKRTAR
ncbi:MAG: hypothetical protein H7A40_01460 [Chlamydiales bacterium]|nr:hypothetical protein [Chlamydiales bacterium]